MAAPVLVLSALRHGPAGRGSPWCAAATHARAAGHHPAPPLDSAAPLATRPRLAAGVPQALRGHPRRRRPRLLGGGGCVGPKGATECRGSALRRRVAEHLGKRRTVSAPAASEPVGRA